MSLSPIAKAEINTLIETVVKKYVGKATSAPQANSGNPFVLALLKDFEPLIHRLHGLKTSIGSEMEKIAEIIAVDAWGKSNVQRKMHVEVMLPQNVFQTVDTIINNLSNAKTLSDYMQEKQLVLDACQKPSLSTEQHTYEFDLTIFDQRQKHFYVMEMKGPDPNTTEVPGAKKRLLVGIAWAYLIHQPKFIDARLAIYYNNKHPSVYKSPKVHYYFNPNGGTLVQDEFWNFLGKDKQTFGELTALFEEYGKANKKKIWDGFSKLINVRQ